MPDDVKEVFLAAAELPEADRPAYLDKACGEDSAMRQRVEALLRAHDAPSEEPAAHAATADYQPLADPGAVIAGRYTLVESIGEGGMGEVWVAKQSEPVKRKVALKLIKAGMDTKAVLQRFDAERQALAMMDHPNIAKVLDGGMTAERRPFFVMELVNGLPLTKFCDEAKLGIRDRLELFVSICRAVQHAHQKGIIHRDLKPSNILVTILDGKPVPKIIDFGVAKAVGGRLTDESLSTQFGAVVGTLEYMSPEQAGFSAADVDTRADIYSLGVILYELLTGLRPIDANRLRQAAVTEMIRIIREEEPSKPSTRLSTDASAPSLAALRHTEPKKLAALLRGELDWVVMKCLEKQRDRRYETANGLARDIQRYLADEPVEARPPSAGYRMRKFLRRNKGPVAAGATVAAALLIGVVAFAWQAKVARDQRDIAVVAQIAEAEQRKLADAATAEAKKQAAIAEAVAKFQTDMLAAADPNKLLGDKVTVVQAIQAAVKELDAGKLKDQPLVEAGVRNTIGMTLYGLGRRDEAEPNLRKSLAIRRADLPTGHPYIATGLNNLALLLQAQNKLAEAEPLYREAMAIRRAARPAGHPEIATGLNNLAFFLQTQNKLAEAESLCREALAIRRAALPAQRPDIAIILNTLASLLQTQNRLAEAEPLYREALEINHAALPAGHPEIARSLNNLAELLRVLNRVAEAEPLYREALQINRTALPAEHPHIAISLNNLAQLLQAQNKFAEAESLFRESLRIRRAALPAGHPDIGTGLNNLAAILYAQKKLAEAEPLFREALAIDRAALPAGHPNIATDLSNLGVLLKDQNKLADAEPLYREALEIFRKALPTGHPELAQSLSNLAVVQQKLGKTAEARAGWDEAVAMLRQGSPQGSPMFARVLWKSGSARLDNKDAAAALSELEEAVAMAEKLLKPDHPHLKEYRETLGRCKAALEKKSKPGAKEDGG